MYILPAITNGLQGFFRGIGDLKITLIDPVLEPIYSSDGTRRTHFDPPFSASDDFCVDAVFCTHNHLDHFQPDTICKLAVSHPQVCFFVPAGILDEISEVITPFSDRVVGLRQDQQLTLFPDISVTTVAVPHDSYQTDSSGNEKALGYAFHCGDTTILHCGDAVATQRLVKEVREIGSIQLAFLPINGRDWVRESKNIIGNMTPREAALFAQEIQCQTVIPTHYDMMYGNEEDPLVFAHYMEQICPDCAWHILRLGEPYLYTYSRWWRDELRIQEKRKNDYGTHFKRRSTEFTKKIQQGSVSYSACIYRRSCYEMVCE